MGNNHVLVCVGSYPPDYGGGGLRLHNLYTRLMTTEPLRVTVLSTSGRGAPAGWDETEGVEVYRIGPTTGKIACFSEILTFFLRYDTDSVDLVHAAGSSVPIISCCICARWLGMRVLRETTISGLDFRDEGWKGALVRWTFRGVGGAIARTEAEEAKLKENGVAKRKLFPMTYPVDEDVFRLPTEEERTHARVKHGFPADDWVHLIVGRIGPRKNQGFALDVLSELPDHHKLVLVGPSSSSEIQKLKDKVRRLGIQQRVVMVGEFVEDVRPYYWLSDMSWVTSIQEGVPNAAKESLLCGRPVVINKSLSIKKFEDYDGLLYSPLTVNAFTNSVISMIDNLDCCAYRKNIRRIWINVVGKSQGDRRFKKIISSLL